MTPRLLVGNQARYLFTATVEDEDIVVRDVRATWFGGPNDPGDNGIGASGFSTKDHPDFLGCALPMKGWKVCAGTPLPHLPWFTKVLVTDHETRLVITAQLIDVGPSPRPTADADIDLTPAVFQAFRIALRRWRPMRGDLRVDYRIPGGAHFVL